MYKEAKREESSAGSVLVDRLVSLGVEQVFGVPGESYLAVIEGLRLRKAQISFTVTRHESGAAMMAVGYAKATGRPGVCMVTRGPGATNASIGVHVARQDGVPLIMIVGQVPRDQRDREALQEVRHDRVFGELAKAAYEVSDPRRMDEYVTRAWHEACAGRPGPVVLSIPEDVSSAHVPNGLPPSAEVALAGPTPEAIERVVHRLRSAQRPLVVLGGYGWDEDGRAGILKACSRLSIPVCASVRQQDLIDNRDRHYVGSLGLGTFPHVPDAVNRADLLLVVGSRLDAFSTEDYGIFSPARHDTRLIHVLPDPADLNTVFPASYSVVATSSSFATALAEEVSRSPKVASTDWLHELRSAYEGRQQEARQTAAGRYVMALAERLPADTIMCGGAGSYTSWYQNSWEFSSHPSQIATQSGSMGFGLPAGIGAGLALPGRTVCVWAGDGCFLMTSQELAVAKQKNLNLLIIVVNNNSYGTIALHQDREYPESQYGTQLLNPDFAALASAYGLETARVTDVEGFSAVLDSWSEVSTPRLIEVQI